MMHHWTCWSRKRKEAHERSPARHTRYNTPAQFRNFRRDSALPTFRGIRPGLLGRGRCLFVSCVLSSWYSTVLHHTCILYLGYEDMGLGGIRRALKTPVCPAAMGFFSGENTGRSMSHVWEIESYGQRRRHRRESYSIFHLASTIESEPWWSEVLCRKAKS